MTLAPAYPKYLRRRDSAVVAGVASGLAAHLRVNVAWIRIAFVVLSVLNGLGAGIYIGLWILSKSVTEGQPIPDRFNKLTSLRRFRRCCSEPVDWNSAAYHSGGFIPRMVRL